jgi:aarF domain-containing kinase
MFLFLLTCLLLLLVLAALSSESPRLQIARLRLAEAQGKIPRGTSEQIELDRDGKVNLAALSVSATAGPVSTSRVRELSWRVAEPAVQYDPDAAARKLFSQPLKWLGRNVQIFVPIAIFTGKVLIDVISKKEEINRDRRAQEILTIISSQSPALIKAGQALSSRSDLLPKEYLDQLQKLQDQCPPYPTEQALMVFEKETGRKFEEMFEFDRSDFKPVAAASIGQVYKARLRSNGQEVAVKIQRPNCESAIAVDLYM